MCIGLIMNDEVKAKRRRSLGSIYLKVKFRADERNVYVRRVESFFM